MTPDPISPGGRAMNGRNRQRLTWFAVVTLMLGCLPLLAATQDQARQRQLTAILQEYVRLSKASPSTKMPLLTKPVPTEAQKKAEAALADKAWRLIEAAPRDKYSFEAL